MTHYDDAKETFRCEHGKVRGTHTCAICDPHLADAALARLQAERDELQAIVDAGEDGYRDMLALERATLLRRTEEAFAARDEAQRQTAALRAALEGLAAKWYEISSRPNRPTGFGICSDELARVLAAGTEKP